MTTPGAPELRPIRAGRSPRALLVVWLTGALAVVGFALGGRLPTTGPSPDPARVTIAVRSPTVTPTATRIPDACTTMASAARRSERSRPAPDGGSAVGRSGVIRVMSPAVGARVGGDGLIHVAGHTTLRWPHMLDARVAQRSASGDRLLARGRVQVTESGAVSGWVRLEPPDDPLPARLELAERGSRVPIAVVPIVVDGEATLRLTTPHVPYERVGGDALVVTGRVRAWSGAVEVRVEAADGTTVSRACVPVRVDVTYVPPVRSFASRLPLPAPSRGVLWAVAREVTSGAEARLPFVVAGGDRARPDPRSEP